jgi:hypothetical protein
VKGSGILDDVLTIDQSNSWAAQKWALAPYEASFRTSL